MDEPQEEIDRLTQSLREKVQQYQEACSYRNDLSTIAPWSDDTERMAFTHISDGLTDMTAYLQLVRDACITSSTSSVTDESRAAATRAEISSVIICMSEASLDFRRAAKRMQARYANSSSNQSEGTTEESHVDPGVQSVRDLLQRMINKLTQEGWEDSDLLMDEVVHMLESALTAVREFSITQLLPLRSAITKAVNQPAAQEKASEMVTEAKAIYVMMHFVKKILVMTPQSMEDERMGTPEVREATPREWEREWRQQIMLAAQEQEVLDIVDGATRRL